MGANSRMCDEEEKPAVVVDNGSGMMKAGCSGEDAPKVTFSSVVGYPKQKTALVGTEAPMNPKDNRERMTSIMFETFNVRRFYLSIQAVLSLYASGRTTGLVVDSGDGVTHTVPIYEGYSMPHAVRRQNLAGRVVTDYFCKILMESGINLSTSAERETAKRIKEELCYVSMNFEEDSSNFAGKEKQFEMPDGTVVTVGDQMIRAPEMLFQPSIAGKELLGMHELAKQTVSDCDMDVRKDLYT